MRQVPRFKRGQLLLHTNKQGSDTLRAPSTNTQNTEGTQAQTDRETHDTQPKEGPEHHQTTENMEAKIAYSPIPSNKVSTSRQSHLPDCEHPSRRTEPTRSLTTHHDAQAPHATTEPSSFTAKPSKLSGPQPARHDKKGQHQTEKSR